MNLLRIIKNSIKAKVMTFVVVCLLTTLTVLGLANFYNAKKILVSDVQDDLKHQAAGYAREIGLWKDTREAEVAILATNQAIVNGDKQAALNYLSEEVKRNPFYSRFWLVDANGQSIHTNGAKTNIADRAYFKQVMSTGKVVTTDPIISKADGKLVISVVAPIIRNNQIIGALGGTVTIDTLAEQVGQIKVAKTGYAYVIQENGLTVIHPDKEQVMKTNILEDKNVSKDLKDIAQLMVKGENSTKEYENAKGKSQYVAYAPVPRTKWSMAITVPEEEILVKLQPFAQTSIAIIVTILILACGISIIVARKLVTPIIMLNEVIEKIAKGDLSEKSLNSGFDKSHKNKNDNDELENMVLHFQIMLEKLRVLIGEISKSAEQVASSSEELTANTEQSALAVGQVAESIDKVAKGSDSQLLGVDEATLAVEKMSASIQQVAAHSENVAITAEKTAQAAKEGGVAISDTNKQMANIDKTVSNSAQVVAKLGERSKEIGQIVDTIAGIAGQTNLLALNAAIEAARAGEQGRGFAVVAEEVRKLAEQSQEAAKHIANLIGEIQIDTEQAVKAMAEGTQEVKKGSEVVGVAGKSFGEILKLIQQVSAQVTDISGAIQQVAGGSEQIVFTIQGIDKVSRETAGYTQTVSAATEEQSATMQEIAASSEDLAKMAEALRATVSEFKV